MSIVEMQKIHIIATLANKDLILKSLQKNEVLDIRNVSIKGLRISEQESISQESIGRYEYELAETKSAISFLEHILQKKKSFIESLIPYKEEINEDQLFQTCQEFNCPEFAKECAGLEEELMNRKNLKSELLSSREQLLPWKKLETTLDTLTCFSKTCIILGKIRNKSFSAFKSMIEKQSPASEIEIINRSKEETYLVLIYLALDKTPFSELLTKTDLEIINLPVSGKTPKQEIDKIDTLLKETENEIQELIDKAKKMAHHISELKIMYDNVLDKKQNLMAKQKFADTNYAFIIEGWIKKHDFEKIRQELSKTTQEFEIFKIKPEEAEQPPIALTNPRILSPFELITKIYGTPKASEFDPSLALSFFFALFFGLCLGDFGYGLMLVLVSLYFLLRFRLPEGGQKLFKLLIFGGAVAMVVGILSGSYLGLNPQEIPFALMPLKQILASIRIIDPIKTPITMLVFSLALGVMQLLFGIALHMSLKIKNKNYLSAFLDEGIWIFFLSSLVFLIVSNALQLETAKLASNMSIAGALGLILTQGRHHKNILAKLLSGVLSLYKVSGYMGDTLSYSRLLALGMSTSIIASVINILAGMVKNGIPVLGFLFMFLLLIFGHIFNLLISTLGAFVHSTRLQMVEFFSKFYEGGGREFKPFKRQAEYTIIK
jgi:V/A-type H+-transporting ATPase subunit I